MLCLGKKRFKELSMLPNEPRIKTLDCIIVMIPYPTRVSYQNVASLSSSGALQHTI